MKFSFRQLFCRHIDKLESQEYLYSNVIAIFGVDRETKRVYANHYSCIKCQRTRLEQCEFTII